MDEVRLIDANALKASTINNFDNLQAYFPKDFIKEIDNAPTVKTYCYYCGQTEHGKIVPDALQGWRYEEKQKDDMYKCPKCSYYGHTHFNFTCPNCGADMRGNKETTFDDYLKEQLKDPEFRKEWEKLSEEEKQ